MGIYRRGSKLYIRYKDADGTWRGKHSGYRVGQEGLAREMYDEIVRLVAADEQDDERDRLIREAPEPLEIPTEESAKGGWIYAIALIPDIDPRRLKIGRTTTTEGIVGRMRQYKTSNPTARLIGLWPGDRRAEKIAHSAVDGRVGRTEVFQVNHVPSALAKIATALSAA